ncbi:signal recognition particle-docking protein FtsY [Euryarchaeota archaeon]|nr:signal recognition particle-docking protein FtsY [Euryarchaeota archaeon]MDB4865191.1 signal recognition particle-docking protein FtsY [Euryarchaeota archaeon]MDC3282093.1 signal recognition particle-docking protein FtsY [Euryarchaeota archaeon]
MGLFDRFKRQAKEAVDSKKITIEEGTVEAEEIIQKREALLLKIENSKKEKSQKIESNNSVNDTDDQWDDFSADAEINPFSKEKDKKSRKLAQKTEKIERIKSEKIPENKPIDRMKTTTGRTLVPTIKNFEIDMSEATVSKGGQIIRGGAVLDEILAQLEEELLQSDMGHSAVMEVISTLKANLIGSRIDPRKGLDKIVEMVVRKSLQDLLEAGYWDFDRTIQSFVAADTPVSIMIVGVNGTGKTTTTAKITHRLTEQGYSVVLAAADTFRAGAIDQLSAHADRLGVRCIKSQRGGDSAAISRDAIESAKAKGDDIVIIDTAGRMQNKTNLMEELRKVHRITKPDLVIFVADALAGNDAVTQAKEFQRILNFDGVALCKLDTDAKGGAALSIAHATGRPIVLAGVGQDYVDLKDFDPEWFLDSILD